MKVLRVYHAGRIAAHRERDRALVRAGVDVTLVVPAAWGGQGPLTDEPFEIVELPVKRQDHINRHTYADPAALEHLIATIRPDVLDLHEEPFSDVTRQWLRIAPTALPVVSYTAQNIDKRLPPPYAQWEQRALRRFQGIYPCTRQAASVVVGKGCTGAVLVLPLPPAPQFTPGTQSAPKSSLAMLLVGRLVPEKGVLDAVRVLGSLRDLGATLEIVGSGPEEQAARSLAAELGVGAALTLTPWLDAADLAERYRAAHVLLAPSKATRTWVEQFGRMVTEAHAAGAVVVGYASGSLPEVVGTAGLLVPEGDHAALADAVRSLVAEPWRWDALRSAGLERATTCTWDVVAAGQASLYDLARTRITAPAVRPQRRRAVATWGEPARISGGGRPFALPVLRDDIRASRVAARAVDAVTRRDRPAPASARPRVVFVNHVAILSGGELALSRLIAAMPEVAAHVILGEDGPLRPALEQAGATVEILALDADTRDVRRAEVGSPAASARAAAQILGYTLRLARRLRQLDPDLVHTNSLKAGYYGSIASHLAGIPQVWHLRDRIAEDYLPARAVTITRAALRRLPDLVVANSAETLSTAGDGLRASAVVPSPVPGVPVVTPSRRTRNLVVGMIGRIAEWKGQDVFLRALALLDDPRISARIIGSAMFGEDAYEESLRSLVDTLGLTSRVTFAGFSSDVPGELAKLDLLVHASVVAEPFGQVVVEGMAAGVPVIASAAGGPAEIITSGVDGVLVPAGDAAALASAMRDLLGDRAKRVALATAGRARAADYSPEAVGARMTSLYRQLLNAPEAGS